MRAATTAALLLSTVGTGLMAGLFTAFAYAVMPGLRRADNHTFVTAMRAINLAILNPWFLGCYLGTLIALGAATLLDLLDRHRPILPHLVVALVLYLATFAVTSAVNVPLNDQLAAAGASTEPSDQTVARRRFERPWVRWNLVRAVTSTGAFVVVVWALLDYGRATG